MAAEILREYRVTDIVFACFNEAAANGRGNLAPAVSGAAPAFALQ